MLLPAAWKCLKMAGFKMYRIDWGSPIKGRVKEKNTPHKKKHAVFSLTLQLLSTRSCAVDYFVPRPLFLSMDRVVFDPHQSPIWFKAIMFGTSKHRPFRCCGPENHRCHAGSNCMFTDHVVINQPLCGCRHRRIKIKNRMWVQQVPIRPGGLIPNPRMVQCCTQTHYRNNLSSSKDT
jgi:hypothetical protein